jgi:hypothetical protein
MTILVLYFSFTVSHLSGVRPKQEVVVYSKLLRVKNSVNTAEPFTSSRLSSLVFFFPLVSWTLVTFCVVQDHVRQSEKSFSE